MIDLPPVHFFTVFRMNKKIIISICLGLLIPALSSAMIFNFKKTFCANEEFVGNQANKRPHLHCGNNFLSYKKANGDHSNISEMGNCLRTNAVFDDIKANPKSFENYQAIYNAIASYHQAGCPN